MEVNNEHFQEHLFGDKIKMPDSRDAAQYRQSVANRQKIKSQKHFHRRLEQFIMEIPAGVIDKGESPAQAAARECEEEIGYVPHSLIELVTYAHAEGYSTAFMTLFLGLDLEFTGKVQLDATEFLEPCTLSLQELKGKVRSGDIIDSKTILGSVLAESRLNTAEKS